MQVINSIEKAREVLISIDVFTVYSMVVIMLAYDFKLMKKMLQLQL